MGREESRRFLREGVVAVLILVWVAEVEAEGGNESTSTVTSRFRGKCRGDVDKLTPCLEYATDKEDKPTEECCRKVVEIRDTSPECLCYVILKANCGEQAVFGIVLSKKKLIELPDACRLAGFNDVSLCPALLGIPDDSPDRAIFNGSDPSRKSIECKPNSAFSVPCSKAAGRWILAVSSAVFSSIFAF